jgi:type II secretory pathway component GspD/PulD (secretin)
VTAQLGEKGTVAALPGENTLVITCDPAVQQSVLTLLAGIDVPPRQVEIGARIFEVDHDFDFQIGAETVVDHISNSTNYQSFESGFSTQSFIESLSSAPVPYQGTVLEVMKVFRDAGVTVNATFHALADAGLVRVVAAPRMTVTVGKTGYMLAGQELPVQSARFQADQILTEKTTYKPIGVQLYITPLVVGPESVKLHVVTVVSAVSGFRELTSMTQVERAQTILNPVIDSREAETFVTVENDATLVIGGLRMIRTITRERKVPLLGDIKLLEWFFKSHRSQNQVNDLYFFITPRLIKTNRKAAANPAARRPLRPTPALLPTPVSARIAVPGRAPAPSPKPAPKPAPTTQPTSAPAPKKAPAPKPPAVAKQTTGQ